MSIFFIVICVVLVFLLVSWVYGALGYKLNGITASGSKYVYTGFAAGLISSLITFIIEERSGISDYFGLDFLFLIAPIFVSYLIVNLTNKEEEKMTDLETPLNVEKQNKSPQTKSIYYHLLDIPVWAIYFLILSTVGITIVILAKIWFPQFFDEEFFWRITYSYLTLIISTVVISKMSEAISFVKKQK